MAAPNQITYTASGITFARWNPNNEAIANTYTGAGTLTDVIYPVTFATGKISITNGSASVSGTDTKFKTDFKAGQYLFYYNMEGDPALAGKIATVSTDTSMTLEAVYPGTSQTLVNCGMSEVVVGGSDQFIIQIPVPKNSATNTCILPNWINYVDSFTPNVIGENNSAYSNIEQYSNVNNPQVPATPPLIEVPYIITPVSNFQKYKGSSGLTVYFQTSADFPKYCYAKLNPYGDSSNVLPANTLFKFFANQRFQLNGITVGLNTDQETLYKSGYIL